MARVRVTARAVEDLAMLVASHGLRRDTGKRVSRRLRALREFPLLGRALSGRYEGMRYVLGPWPWLLIVYEFREASDDVIVLAMFDARSATSLTNQ
jgi:plasmid stabilization system protein ParE